jgi:hypothetical protein
LHAQPKPQVTASIHEEDYARCKVGRASQTMITLYHSTTRENAESILREGLRDQTDEYMTSQLHTGVWLSDTPLDENEGACSEALLVLQLDEVTVAHFEWIEDGKGYREFLVPAAIVNSVKCVLALA